MTAINILVRSDRVHIMTDGSLWEPEGAIIGVAQKAFVLAHVSAVIAIRGPTYLAPGLVGALNASGLRSFDDLLTRLPTMTAMLIDHAIEQFDPTARAEASARIDLRRFEIVIAGWSHKRGRGEVYSLNTSDPGWRVENKGVGLLMPWDNPALITRLKETGWCIEDEADDAARLLELVRHQREVSDRLPNGASFATVGGFAQHTVITPDAVTTRIVERWDA